MSTALYEGIEVGECDLFPGPVIKLWADGVLEVIPVDAQGIAALGEACTAWAREHAAAVPEVTR
jgi:hypothetical protein